MVINIKRIIFVFSLIVFIVSCSTKVFSLADNARSACLYATTTNQVLYKSEESFPLAPASMTKIMTLTLIFEYLTTNNISYDEMVSGSEYSSSMGGSQVYLESNESLSINDMLKCICIASANDCAVAMAEYVAGSEEEFVNKMNEKCTALNLKNTHFMDCTGLTTKNHYSSAYDMAIM